MSKDLIHYKNKDGHECGHEKVSFVRKAMVHALRYDDKELLLIAVDHELPQLWAPAAYPLEALPPLMRDAARAIADHVQAPYALAGQCVIGAVSASAQAIDADTGEVKPPVLELSTAAEADWLEFYNEVEGEQSPLGKFSNLRPFAGRAGEIVRRLAAVFACFEDQTKIDSECMRRAADLVRHSLGEWSRYTDSEAVNPDKQGAAALLDWLICNSWQSFDARTLQRNGPSAARKSAKQRNRLLAILVDHYQLLTDDGKQFTINPFATTATTATKPANLGANVCDNIATGCDKLPAPPVDLSLSQGVAPVSQTPKPAAAQLVAEVAVVAAFGGEI